MSTPVKIPSEKTRNTDTKTEIEKLWRKPTVPLKNETSSYSSEPPIVNEQSIKKTGIDGKLSDLGNISGNYMIDFLIHSRQDCICHYR